MSIVKINGKPYKFTEHENELIKKNGLTPGMVAKRVRGGWALLEALHAPYGMRLAEYKEIVLSKIMEREAREREIARQRRKEAESLEEAEFEAHDIARMEVPFDCDEFEINVEVEQEND